MKIYPEKVIFAFLLLFLGCNLIFVTLKSSENSVHGQSEPSTPIPVALSPGMLIDILQPTVACQIPCWWDIVPGVTTIDQAKQMLEYKFGSIVKRTFQGRYDATHERYYLIELYSSNETINRQVTPSFESMDHEFLPVLFLHILSKPDNIVSSISLGSGGFYLKWLDKPDTIWKDFEIINFLDTYGVPNTIRVRTMPTVEGEKIFYMHLYWDEVGLGAIYDFDGEMWTEAQEHGILPLTSACFNFANLDQSEFYFVSPGQENNRPSIIRLEGSQTITELTGLSNREFTEILRENDGCIPAEMK